MSHDFPLHTGHCELRVVECLILFHSVKECWTSSQRRVKVLAGQFDPFRICWKASVGLTQSGLLLWSWFSPTAMTDPSAASNKASRLRFNSGLWKLEQFMACVSSNTCSARSYSVILPSQKLLCFFFNQSCGVLLYTCTDWYVSKDARVST